MHYSTDFQKELLQRMRSALKVVPDRVSAEKNMLAYVESFRTLESSPAITVPIRQIYVFCGNTFPRPYIKRLDLLMKADAFLRLEWGACLDAGILNQALLRKIDNSLMKALEHQFSGRPQELSALIPNRNAVAALKHARQTALNTPVS